MGSWALNAAIVAALWRRDLERGLALDLPVAIRPDDDALEGDDVRATWPPYNDRIGPTVANDLPKPRK
jgi:hypothetical protein